MGVIYIYYQIKGWKRLETQFVCHVVTRQNLNTLELEELQFSDTTCIERNIP